jgi:hypothetical protein
MRFLKLGFCEIKRNALLVFRGKAQGCKHAFPGF